MDLSHRLRGAIGAACAASLTLTTPAAVAQSTGSSRAAQVCGMQQANNPNCHVPPSAGSVRVTPPGRGNYPADDDDRDGLGVLEIFGIIGGIVAAVLLARALTGEEDVPVDDMRRDGPRTPNQELLGQYEVQGIVQGGWPLVVEVAADADATIFVQVVPAGGGEEAIPPLVLSDAGGRPWGEGEVIYPVELERTERGLLAKFELPDRLARGRGGEGTHSARLSVISGAMRGEEFDYRPLDVLALGAGPSAVGSAAVEISRFGPAPETRRAEYRVTLRTPRAFANLRAELIRREQAGRETRRTRIASQDVCRPQAGLDVCEDMPPRLPFPIDGSWPTDTGGELGQGETYHMELRAFTGRIRSGGWLVAQAPRVVTWP